ncbi:MAG TPA: NUDIX domain-containing protein [Candidatus Competibacteraceae bacterium]|nr:NUDIX domain-containing protein [Candidatus Competibacteraceae bacterium]HRZ05912.1 NUDIX domain-containing protein [Candidatus Competibacteraceae bacterium]HSA46745.1 NUDIX domain-containing protein [Candidatus Competibacteraceae bacterium]
MNYQFTVLEKTIGYDGFFRMEKYRLRHELFRGSWSPDITRECLERGHAVAVLLYDPDQDQVVLLEQFRVGALEFPGGPWLLEIVAGIMDDPTETAEEVARRETAEEAGCELLDLLPICHYLVSPGGASESITLFCGRVDASEISGLSGLAEEHEDIQLHVVSRTEALDLLQAGRINSAAPIIALQWLELNRSRLLERWGLASG